MEEREPEDEVRQPPARPQKATELDQRERPSKPALNSEFANERTIRELLSEAQENAATMKNAGEAQEIVNKLLEG